MPTLPNVDINVLGTNNGTLSLEIVVDTLLEVVTEGTYGPYNKQCLGCKKLAILVKLIKRVLEVVEHEHGDEEDIKIVVQKRPLATDLP